MPPVLNVDRELGRKIKAAREQRGWSKPLLAAMIGPLGDPPRGLVPNQITRMESGERNLTADEAWRLVDLYEEIDPWEILAAARVVSVDSSEEFRQAIREEAERRRRRGTLRRLEFSAQSSVVSRGTRRSPAQLAPVIALPVDPDLDRWVEPLRPHDWWRWNDRRKGDRRKRELEPAA